MPSESEGAPDVPVKATRVSFDVVEALQELNSAGVTELADHLGLPPSTVHGLDFD